MDTQLYANDLYPDYRFSKDGRIWTKAKKTEWEPLKAEKPAKKKYLRVYIKNKEGKYKHEYVHRVIATVFIPNPNNYPCINHKDENGLNNKINNLEWCTYQQNNIYGSHLKKCMAPIIKKWNDCKIPVTCIDASGKKYHFDSIREAAKETNCRESNICKCLKGSRKTAGGYIWEKERKETYA